MAFFKRWFRRFALWGIPIIVLLMLLLGSAVYWVLATQTGTRWALQLALPYAQGSAQGIRGTIWHGLDIDQLSLSLPDTHIEIEQARLHVDWVQLRERRLQILELSAAQLDVALSTPTEPESPPQTQDEPFSMPQLPVNIALNSLVVGKFHLQQDGQALPVQVENLAGAISLAGQEGQVRLYSLDVGYEDMQARVQGDVDVSRLAMPFPLSSHIEIKATGKRQEALLCAQQYLPAFELQQSDQETEALCQIDTVIKLHGSLDEANLEISGAGQGLQLQATALLSPAAAAPVQQAKVTLGLPDDSRLDADLQWQVQQQGELLLDHITSSFTSDSLDLRKLSGNIDSIPDALLLAQGKLDLRLVNRSQLQQAQLSMDVHKGSRWNKAPLQGKVDLAAFSAAEPGQADWWQFLRLRDSLVNLELGKNKLRLQGGLGEANSELNLSVAVPHAQDFWPGLELGALQASGQLSGDLAHHALRLKVDYDLGGKEKNTVGQGALQAALQMRGAWQFARPEQAAQWKAQLGELDVRHAGIGVKLESALPLVFKPAITPAAPAQVADATAAQTEAPEGKQAVAAQSAQAQAKPWSLEVGAARIATFMADKPWVVLSHQRSTYQGGHWRTQGGIDKMVLSQARLKALQKLLGLEQAKKEEKGGVKILARPDREPVEIDLQANWDLAFADALSGSLNIERVSGDILVPADPSFLLGLQDLALRIQATPTKGGRSNLGATLDLRTKEMGYITAKAETQIHATDSGGLELRDKDPKVIRLDADIDDLGWTSLFLGDAMELGGKLKANLQIDVGAGWKWTSKGSMQGRDLRFTLLDEGVRLLGGTLEASFENKQFRLDKLYFPALLRVEPMEWRTATWVSEDPEAKDGGLTVSGQWDLENQRGDFVADIHRFPILQRSDRYAMLSGKLNMDMHLPQIAIRGKVTADAGWFNLDMLGGIPTIDSDVMVVRGDYQEQEDEQVEGLDGLSMEVEVDLGPRFYLTGYGVNSGLVGSLKISMIGGRLTGIGVLRTRGGRVELYGQKLLLRRGMVTFQGDITAPTLDIEALRTGLAVQAGVKVVGTARRPRIDLVSYPDVDESEKLSWLLLGHGSDHSGGDLALLLSVGTSFLGDGEPFYRRFGIDEVGMSSGDLGSVGSILPVENVVPTMEEGVSDEERRFVTISKVLTSKISLSLQQALSDTGTVGRASYRLANGLTAELSAGTVNGLALIYRWFSSD